MTQMVRDARRAIERISGVWCMSGQHRVPTTEIVQRNRYRVICRACAEKAKAARERAR